MKCFYKIESEIFKVHKFSFLDRKYLIDKTNTNHFLNCTVLLHKLSILCRPKCENYELH